MHREYSHCYDSDRAIASVVIATELGSTWHKTVGGLVLETDFTIQ